MVIVSSFVETAESVAALRSYFEAHERANEAMTAARFADAMAQANRASELLRNMPRPTNNYEE